MHAEFRHKSDNIDTLEKYFMLFQKTGNNPLNIFCNYNEYSGYYEKKLNDVEDVDYHCSFINRLPKELTKNICTNLESYNIYHNTFIQCTQKPITNIELLENLSNIEIILNINSSIELTPNMLKNCRDLYDCNCKFSNDIFNTIDYVVMNNEFDNELPNMPNCKILYTGEKFNKSLKPLPEVKSLIFGSNFNQDLEDNSLPNCEYVYFGRYFNSNINNALENVKIIDLSKSSFNKPIINLSNCIDLYLNSVFNSEIILGSLPNAKSINLGGYNKPIKINMLPSCEVLNLTDDFDSTIEPDSLPKLKKINYFGTDPSIPLKPNIFPNVDEIRFNSKFNSIIELNALPNAYVITLNNNYDKPISAGVFNKCKILYVSFINDQDKLNRVFQRGFAPNLDEFIYNDDDSFFYHYKGEENGNHIWILQSMTSNLPKEIILNHK